LTRERRLPTPLIEHVSRGGYVVWYSLLHLTM
jgi:hypothetical protein